MADTNEISIAGSVADAIVIAGNGNHVTVYLAAGVSRAPDPLVSSGVANAVFVPNPYRGLAAFFEEDADRFFGRGREISRLWEAFRALFEATPGRSPTRLLPILGPSGSGKSSLTRAGLLPEIARHVLPALLAPQVVVLTPTPHPIGALARILAKIATGDPAPVAKASEFELKLRRVTDGRFEGLQQLACYAPGIDRRKLVLVIDQFEELYTLCVDPIDRDAFIGNLLYAARYPSADVSIILTLRTDFIGNTQRHIELNRLVTEHAVIVPAMDELEIREAITKPANDAGRPLDPAVVELLVQDTVGRDGALPLLQFALQRLWDAMTKGKNPVEAFKEIGGVGGALAQEADQLYESLSAPHQKIIRRAFRAMVQLGEGVPDTRRRVDLNEIISNNFSTEEVLSVLRTFAQPSKRLITLEGTKDTVLIEVTHEALITRWRKIHDWLGPRQREDERFHRQVTEASTIWCSNEKRADLLWSGFNLDRLIAFAKRTDDDLTATEQQFLASSSKAAENAKLISRRRTQGTIAAALVMGLLTILALRERSVAIDSANRAADNLAQSEINARIARENARKEQTQREAADAAGREASLHYSKYLTSVAKQKLSSADYTTAALLAVEAIHGVGRFPQPPHLEEAEAVLYEAVLRNRELIDLIGHEQPITDAGLSPSADRVASVSADSIWIWDTSSGHVFKKLSRPVGSSPNTFRSVTFSADGLRLMAVEVGGASIWDIASGNRLESFDGDLAWFSHDGGEVTTASKEGLYLINTVTNVRKPLLDKNSVTTAVAGGFSADGKRFGLSDDTRALRIWDLESGRLIFSEKTNEEIVALSFSPDDDFIVTAGRDGLFAVERVDSKRTLYDYKMQRSVAVTSMSMSEDRRRVLIGSSDLGCVVWDLMAGTFTPIWAHTDITSCAFSSDEKLIAVGSSDGKTRIVDAGTRRLQAELVGHTLPISQIHFSTNDSKILTVSDDKTMRIWSSNDRQVERSLGDAGGQVKSAVLSQDGSKLAVLREDGKVCLWNAIEAGCHFGASGVFTSIAFAPDGSRLALGAADGAIRIMETDTGRTLSEWQTTDDQINSLAFGPDGHLLVSGSDLGVVSVWSDGTGQWGLVGTKLAQPFGITLTAFAPDGMQLLTINYDNLLTLVDIDRHKTLFSSVMPGKLIRTAAFTKDGHEVLLGSDDGRIIIVDASNGQVVGSLIQQAPVCSIAVDPSTTRIVSATKDGETRIWRGSGFDANSSPETVMRSASYEPVFVGFSQRPNHIIAVAREGMIKETEQFSNSGDLIRFAEAHLPRKLGKAERAVYSLE